MQIYDNEPLVLAGLTHIEQKILGGLVRGESIKSLSGLLALTQQEVLEARGALMEKLSAETTADLVRIGLVARVLSEQLHRPV